MRDLNKIFVIEDDLNILYGLRDIFTSNDFEVEISDSREDTEELISKIRKFKPDSVILDMVLPEIDGQDLIKRIKSDSSISDAEIFIFTDLSEADGRSRSVGLGANYYFMKGEFDVYTFSSKVMRIMERESLSSDDEKEEEEAEDLLVMD
ncbi:MAG TPA: response regulator [bacterium]|mgnify:CR=1 FL=1|nr:response regulator [bacterium]HPV65396.1 response regulator [bacterium]